MTPIQKATKFNTKYKAGTPCLIKLGDREIKTRTSGYAWAVEGKVVVFVEGLPKPVEIEKITIKKL